MTDRWQPPVRALVAELGTGLVVLAAVVTGHPAEAGGRLLLAVGALGLLGAGARDAARRPMLEAGPDGIRVWAGRRRYAVAWADLPLPRTVVERRTPLLELDVDGRPVLLSRFQLGAPPAVVLGRLSELRR